ADLADFAVGFSLSERVIEAPGDIETLEVASIDDGILLRMTLAKNMATAYSERRRYLAGPSGCGLCGIESLAEAARMPPSITGGTGGVRVSSNDIFEAMAALPASQPMNRATGA